MEVTIIESLMGYGLPGVVIAILVWFLITQTKRMHVIQDDSRKHYEELLKQSNKREEVQSQRFDEQQKELGKLSNLLSMLVEDVRDLRRKVGLRKED